MASARPALGETCAQTAATPSSAHISRTQLPARDRAGLKVALFASRAGEQAKQLAVPAQSFERSRLDIGQENAPSPSAGQARNHDTAPKRILLAGSNVDSASGSPRSSQTIRGVATSSSQLSQVTFVSPVKPRREDQMQRDRLENRPRSFPEEEEEAQQPSSKPQQSRKLLSVEIVRQRSASRAPSASAAAAENQDDVYGQAKPSSSKATKTRKSNAASVPAAVRTSSKRRTGAMLTPTASPAKSPNPRFRKRRTTLGISASLPQPLPAKASAPATPLRSQATTRRMPATDQPKRRHSKPLTSRRSVSRKSTSSAESVSRRRSLSRRLSVAPESVMARVGVLDHPIRPQSPSDDPLLLIGGRDSDRTVQRDYSEAPVRRSASPVSPAAYLRHASREPSRISDQRYETPSRTSLARQSSMHRDVQMDSPSPTFGRRSGSALLQSMPVTPHERIVSRKSPATTQVSPAIVEQAQSAVLALRPRSTSPQESLTRKDGSEGHSAAAFGANAASASPASSPRATNILTPVERLVSPTGEAEVSDPRATTPEAAADRTEDEEQDWMSAGDFMLFERDSMSPPQAEAFERDDLDAIHPPQQGSSLHHPAGPSSGHGSESDVPATGNADALGQGSAEGSKDMAYTASSPARPQVQRRSNTTVIVKIRRVVVKIEEPDLPQLVTGQQTTGESPKSADWANHAEHRSPSAEKPTTDSACFPDGPTSRAGSTGLLSGDMRMPDSRLSVSPPSPSPFYDTTRNHEEPSGAAAEVTERLESPGRHSATPLAAESSQLNGTQDTSAEHFGEQVQVQDTAHLTLRQLPSGEVADRISSSEDEDENEDLMQEEPVTHLDHQLSFAGGFDQEASAVALEKESTATLQGRVRASIDPLESDGEQDEANSSLVQVTSADPKAAARAAAILKLHYGWVERGSDAGSGSPLKGRQGNRISLVPTTPRVRTRPSGRRSRMSLAEHLQEAELELAIGPDTNAQAIPLPDDTSPARESVRMSSMPGFFSQSDMPVIEAQPRPAQPWTITDWRRLERAYRRVQRKCAKSAVNRAVAINVDDVLEVFFAETALNAGQLSDEHRDRSDLELRVQALSRRLGQQAAQAEPAPAKSQEETRAPKRKRIEEPVQEASVPVSQGFSTPIVKVATTIGSFLRGLNKPISRPSFGLMTPTVPAAAASMRDKTANAPAPEMQQVVPTRLRLQQSDKSSADRPAASAALAMPTFARSSTHSQHSQAIAALFPRQAGETPVSRPIAIAVHGRRSDRFSSGRGTGTPSSVRDLVRSFETQIQDSTGCGIAAGGNLRRVSSAASLGGGGAAARALPRSSLDGARRFTQH